VLAGFGRLPTYGNAAAKAVHSSNPGILAAYNHTVAGVWLRPAIDYPGRSNPGCTCAKHRARGVFFTGSGVFLTGDW
jgi:hypothetical protein